MTDMLPLVGNTRLLDLDFTYLAATSRAEALALLARYRDAGVRILAGGTDLLVRMKTGAMTPALVVDIQPAGDMRYIRSGRELAIGAVTSLATVERSPAVRAVYPALFEAVQSMAGPAIRHMGTLGGNLCNASPAADTAPALLVLGAVCVLVSAAGSRTVPAAEFFAGPGRTVLAPDELLAEVRLPSPGADSGSSFVKLGRVEGDIAKVSAAAYLERSGDGCARCRIALGAVAPTPVRVPAAENLLTGARLSRHLVAAAAQQAAAEIRPITDVRSTAAYRRELAAVLVEAAVASAWIRSGGVVR